MNPSNTALKRYETIRQCLFDGVSHEEAALVAGISVRTIRRWVLAYSTKSLAGLTPHERRDKGVRRISNAELLKIIKGLYLRVPPPPITVVHRKIQNICQKNVWRVPSYDVIHDIISKLAADLKLLAHKPEEYKQEFALVYRYEASKANELWQCDHTPLDILILDDKNQPARPVLTAVIDDYSRAVPGYYLAFEPPSSLRVALALRQAIWRKDDSRWKMCGIPEKFYSDRGSDFMSQHIEQVSIDLKFEHIQTLPREPQGKGKCERFFESVNMMFLAYQPGYKPEGAGPVEAVLTLEELDKKFRDWLLNEYLVREHSEIKMAPGEKWESCLFMPSMPESKEQLDMLLVTVAKPRKVWRDGIRFSGFRYFHVNLAGYVQEEVTIRYDPRDLSEISVYSENRLICRAICDELTDCSISLKDVIRARNARKRDLKQELKEFQELADKHAPIAKPEGQVISITTAHNYPKFKIKRFACDDD